LEAVISLLVEDLVEEDADEEVVNKVLVETVRVATEVAWVGVLLALSDTVVVPVLSGF